MNNTITSSLGAGAGFNVSALVRDLAAASREPKVARLNALVQQNQARISAVSQAKSDLDGLAKSLAQMVTDGTLRSVPTASNKDVLDLTAAAGVAPSAFSGSVEVVQLARGQSLNSAVVASRTAPIGEGSFTLALGGANHTITVNAANNSLDGLADFA
jgi:flagellar hook-associated protein 2